MLTMWESLIEHTIEWAKTDEAMKRVGEGGLLNAGVVDLARARFEYSSHDSMHLAFLTDPINFVFKEAPTLRIMTTQSLSQSSTPTNARLSSAR